jgi:hypothetical protein
MNLVSDFNSKVKNGEIQTIFKPCLCSSAKFTKVVDKDRYGLWHPVYAAIAAVLFRLILA